MRCYDKGGEVACAYGGSSRLIRKATGIVRREVSLYASHLGRQPIVEVAAERLGLGNGLAPSIDILHGSLEFCKSFGPGGAHKLNAT